MSARLTTAVQISALIRRVGAEGGHATVLHKGDPTAGAVLLALCEKGVNYRFFERILGLEEGYRWRQIGINLGDDSEKMADFLGKRQRLDPDLWVVELDIAQPERFIDESSQFV